MQTDSLGNLHLYPLNGVQGGHGVLENHRHIPSPDLIHLFIGFFQQRFAVERNTAPHNSPRRVWNQPEDTETGSCLTCSRFSHQSKRFAPLHLKLKPIECLHNPSIRFVLYPEILNVQHHIGCFMFSFHVGASSLLQPWIECVAQPIAQQVQR